MEISNIEKQWVVVEDGLLIQTYGRKLGSRDAARREAKRRRQFWSGAKAILLTQEKIDKLPERY